MRTKAWFGVFVSLVIDRIHKSISISNGSSIAWNDGFLGGSVTYGTENYSVPFSFIILACIFCYFILLTKFVKNPLLLISSGAFLGSMLSNLIDRILYQGVVADPIRVGHAISTNIADLVQLVSMGTILWLVFADAYFGKKADQRLNLFRNRQQQTKIFFETMVVTSVVVLLFTGIHYFTLHSLTLVKMDLITGILIVPLAGLFITLLSNTRYGALKSLERHLSDLKENPAAQFSPREDDDPAEIQKLYQLIQELMNSKSRQIDP